MTRWFFIAAMPAIRRLLMIFGARLIALSVDTGCAH
jgi:hypothetical protein